MGIPKYITKIRSKAKNWILCKWFRRVRQKIRTSRILVLFLSIPLDPIWYYCTITIVMVEFNVNLYIALTTSCLGYSDYWDVFVQNLQYIYAVDVFGVLLIKVLKIPKPLICLADRPYFVLVIELMTLVPYHLMMPNNPSEESKKYYCLILLKYLLRVVRPLYFLSLYNRQLTTKPIVTYFVLVCGISIFALSSVGLYCNLDSESGKVCNDSIHVIMMGVSSISLVAIDNLPVDSITWNLGNTILVMLAYIVVLMPTMVQLMVNVIFTNMLRYIYIFMYKSQHLTQTIYNVPVQLKNQTAKYFDKIWKVCGGYSQDLGFFEVACHPALSKEIRLDVSWPAFQHSRMFREFDMYFLLQMSDIIRHQFLVANEYIYKKGEVKQKMVYIVSGTIDVLSETDTETRIISLTQGTCIGEASLIFSYISENGVRCKTFCELLVIERSDFIKLMYKIPSKGRYLRKMIEDRIVFAKDVKSLADKAKSKHIVSYRSCDTYTIYWLKYTLHKLMSLDPDSTERHELQNIYLLNKMDETVFDPLIFTAEYLDMLSIAERHDLEKNTVFAKSTFPYIFQPDSIAVEFYKYLVAIVTIFASIWLPYKAFLENSSGEKNFLPAYVITGVYVLDVVLLLSTAIVSRNGIIIKRSAIFLHRLGSIIFWFDVAASAPLESFAAVIIRELNDQNLAVLRLNRLLKICTLVVMFREREKKFTANVVLLRYIRFTTMHLYAIYFIYCIMCYLFPDLDYGILLFTVTQMSYLSKNKDTDFLNPYGKILVAINFVFQFLFIAKAIYVLSAILMANLSRLYAQQYCHDVFTKIEEGNLPKIYKVRTAEYLRLQYEENMGIHLQTDFYYLSNITRSLHDGTMDAITSDIWKYFSFFGDYLKEVTDDMYSIMSLETLPANEVIVYSGDYFRKCYIKHVGIIEIVDQFGNVLSQENETINRVINLVPCILNVPSLFTMKTITENRFIVFKIEDLLLAIIRHPKHYEILRNTINLCSDISQRLIELASVETNFVVPPSELPSKKNLCSFGYNYLHGSAEEYEYYSPFDRLYPFSFLRVFLLRNTIYPESKVILILESFRSFFAILSSLFFMMPPIFLTPYRYIHLLLDIAACVDMYLRMHVCYYTSQGILVSHPLMTTRHYLSHGFLLDLIGVVPIHFVATPYDATSYFATHGNKLLQMHRYISFMYTLQVKSLTSVPQIFLISYVPVLLVVGHFFGSFIIHAECEFGVETTAELPEFITCYNDSIIEMSNFQKPITPLMGQAIALYIGISFATTTSWQNFLVLRNASRIRVMILGLIGQTFLVTSLAYVCSFFMYRHGLLTEYQHAMRQLLAFIKLLKVPNELRKCTINYCNDKWTLLKGKPFQNVVKKLHVPIQTDLLYDYYGIRAYTTSAFQSKSIPFYRNLIAVSSYDIVVKHGYPLTINDVTDTLVIILRGSADVIAADGTVMATLYPGAIIGNLNNREWMRAHVSVIANCHVEIFTVKSKMFYYILNRFPKTKAEYEYLKLKYVHYIPSLGQTLNPEELELYAPKRKLIYTKTFHPDAFLIKVWLTIQLIFPCYIGILLDFYQMSTGNHNPWIIICQWCCDVLFIIHFIVRNRIAYINDYGVLVRDPQKIKMRNSKNRFQYWLTFISIIPFDLLTFLMPLGPWAMRTIYTTFRMNRMIRLVYVFEFFSMMNKKLNTNIYVVRFGFIIVWTSLVLFGVAALLGVVGCNLSVNITPHIPHCSVLHGMEDKNMTRLHSTLVYIALHGLTMTTQYTYSPQHPLLVLIFVVLMLVSHTLRAIIAGQIFAAISDVNEVHLTFKMIRRRLNFYCVSQDLYSAVNWRMSMYTDLLWFMYKGVKYPTLLTTLNPYIKDVLLASCCQKFFINHYIFKDCHPDFLRQMIRNVTFRMSFNSGYIEFKENVEDAMFFIMQGEIEVIEDIFQNKVVVTLKPGQSFGVLQGIRVTPTYDYSFRCIGTTIVVVLLYQDWRYLLQFYPASNYIIYNRAQTYEGF